MENFNEAQFATFMKTPVPTIHNPKNLILFIPMIRPNKISVFVRDDGNHDFTVDPKDILIGSSFGLQDVSKLRSGDIFLDPAGRWNVMLTSGKTGKNNEGMDEIALGAKVVVDDHLIRAAFIGAVAGISCSSGTELIHRISNDLFGENGYVRNKPELRVVVGMVPMASVFDMDMSACFQDAVSAYIRFFALKYEMEERGRR